MNPDASYEKEGEKTETKITNGMRKNTPVFGCTYDNPFNKTPRTPCTNLKYEFCFFREHRQKTDHLHHAYMLLGDSRSARLRCRALIGTYDLCRLVQNSLCCAVLVVDARRHAVP